MGAPEGALLLRPVDGRDDKADAGAPGADGGIALNESSFAWSASMSTFTAPRGAPHCAHTFAMGLLFAPQALQVFMEISAGLKHMFYSFGVLCQGDVRQALVFFYSTDLHFD